MIRGYLRALGVVCAIASTAAQQPPATLSQEAAIVEQTRTTYRFERDGTGRRELYTKVRVQSEAGVQGLGELVFGYNAATERLEFPFVKVHKPDGKIVETAAASIQDLTSPVERIAPVYTDFHQKRVSVQGLRPGDTLELSAVTTIHTPLAPGQFWLEAEFNEDAIVQDEQLDIDVPADKPILLKVAPGYEAASTKDVDGRRIFHWARTHLVREDEKKKAEREKKRAWDEPERSPVRLTTFSDWKAVGEWFGALERGARQPGPEVRAKAKELTAGRTTDLEKIEALYDYVSKNFRYVSLSLGLGRYQPRAAADVMHDAYGDCKDKHTLLASLIEAAGLQASPVLINSSLKIDPDFPSPTQFDHVITRARTTSGQDVWMDSTPEVAPFRLLSFPLRHKLALVVEPAAASRLVETPSDLPSPALVSTDVDGTIDESGALSASVKLAARGDVELALRAVFRATPAAQWQKMAEEIATRLGVTGKLSELNVSDPQATRDPFAVSFRIQSPTFANWSRRNLELALPFASGNESPESPEAGPIVLGTVGQTTYRLTLTVPAAAKLRAPAAVSISRDYGDYQASYTVSGARLTAERTLLLRESEIPQARREDYEAFRRVLTSDGRQRLGVDATAITAPAATASDEAKVLNRSGYDALQARDYKKAVKDLKRVVELEPSDKVAWNNLGRAYMGLQQTDDAIAAYKRQIEVNPYDEYAHNNLGSAYLRQRKYDLAEASFKKQIEINPLDRYASANLGRMYVQRHQYDLAVPALQKAIAITPDQASLHIQLGKAFVNLRRNDEAAAAFAKAVELAPTPLTWNDVGYELALGGIDLDRAQRYAESAVSAVTAASRNLDVNNADPRALAVVSSLASYWDTLGWVHFARKDYAKAEKYVAAAWNLAQSAEVGDHLGQIYERTGRTNLALPAYARALAASSPAEDVRDHLEKLAGGPDKVDGLVAAHRGDLAKARSISIDAKGPTGKTADVFILFSPPGIVEAVAFVEGDETMKPLLPAVQKVKVDGMFPDDAPAKLLRRGILSCAAGSPCAIMLLLPEDAKPAK